MIFQAPILAMLLVSLLSGLTMIWAGLFAWRVVRNWDIESGSALQIDMEKRTFLVVSLVRLVLVMELLSLLLFVLNADRMADLFTGAMCALGTLNVDRWGFPALMLKIAVFFGAMIWLLVNRIDERGRDYPLTRRKYALLLGLAPLVIVAGIVQFLYFYNLRADVITSCCSHIFTPEGRGVQADLSSLPPRMALYLLLGGFGVVAIAGHFLFRAGKNSPLLKWRWLYGPLSALFFVIAITVVISLISVYVYEMPHHHCPFCLLKWQYGHIGLWLYMPLFFGAAYGMAAGLLAFFPTPASMGDLYETLTARQIAISSTLFALFMAISAFIIWRSHLILMP